MLRSRRSISSKVPSLFHLSKKSQAVDQGQYSPGTSRQGAPVRSTQKIASRICRRSRGRRPLLRTQVGNRSATNSHWASVNWWRGMRVLAMPLVDHDFRLRPKNRRFQPNRTEPSFHEAQASLETVGLRPRPSLSGRGSLPEQSPRLHGRSQPGRELDRIIGSSRETVHGQLDSQI